MTKKLMVAGTRNMSNENFVKHWNHRHREDLGLSPMVLPRPLKLMWWAFHRRVHLHNPTNHDHRSLETPRGH